MTIFASMNQFFNSKLSLFLTKVSFNISEENQLSFFQKCIFFQNLGKMQVKKNYFCELFTNNFFRYTFVTFVLRQTIVGFFSVHHYRVGGGLCFPSVNLLPFYYKLLLLLLFGFFCECACPLLTSCLVSIGLNNVYFILFVSENLFS